MHILYYITAHGYGHGVRSCNIINSLPLSMRVTVRTMLPEAFFKEELSRPFDYWPGAFDCGCIQVDGVTVDVEKTLLKYKSIAEKNRTLLDSEVNWCKEHRVSCIIADSTPFAIDIARKAAIASVVISNFTWYDIYSQYVSKGDGFLSYLEEMKKQYSSADLLLSLFPANPMGYMQNRIEIPVIGRIGRSKRDEIAQMYGFCREKKIGLIYIGQYGMDQVQWPSLEKLYDWEFLSLYAIDGNPSNFHIVNKEFFNYPDLTASVDVVISKPGYGVVSDCFVNGVSLLYLPRSHFAEYPVLVNALENWGGGCFIPEHDFYTLNWKPYLDLIMKMNKPQKIESDGIKRCITAITNIIHKGSFK